MIPVHVALVDDSGHVGPDALASCAAALNEQIQADFAPHWHVRATVGAYARGAVPAACWAVRIRTRLDQPGALGYHADAHNQPYALVELTGDWTTTVGHEVLEMLADPWGNRMHTAHYPMDINPADIGLTGKRTRVQYLVEVCDPCETFSYEVGGVTLSDFLKPSYYRTTPEAGNPATHLASCAPREVREGGYVSFAVGDEWWQAFNQGGALKLSDLGRFDRTEFASLREFTDHHARAREAS